MNKVSVNPQLQVLNAKLKDLHRALLYSQARIAEKEDNRKYGPVDLWKLAIHDPRFDWLRRVSKLITRIDMYLSGEKDSEPFLPMAIVNEVHGMLSGVFADFRSHYQVATQSDPGLTILEVDVKKAVTELKDAIDLNDDTKIN